ncbi:uncharacterized protein EAE98_005795 [Botrytis deweyae]|uniref:Uncharacterized protein n=1 Tax=Botrytis deweyae TaxID=2478750 RepID=A0ABQ7IMS1_9HELO|nr:uncharacterized protein EAE98_005795 [Botrytis deweyae]KAF7928739.1 hypothetical protein EAE98_005795 [Botrytis deweyae]
MSDQRPRGHVAVPVTEPSQRRPSWLKKASELQDLWLWGGNVDTEALFLLPTYASNPPKHSRVVLGASTPSHHIPYHIIIRANTNHNIQQPQQPTSRTMTVTLHSSPSSYQVYQYQNQAQHAMWLEQRQVCPTMHKSTQFIIVQPKILKINHIGIMGWKIR